MWGSFSELCGASSLASPRIEEAAETCAAVNAVARLFRVRQCLVLVAYVYSAAVVRVERDLAAAVASAQREACHRRVHVSSCFGALGNRIVVLCSGCFLFAYLQSVLSLPWTARTCLLRCVPSTCTEGSWWCLIFLAALYGEFASCDV